MRMALVVEYEGTNYSGFQYQENAPSIQGELEKAIARLTGERVRIRGAGRTDAGVHAKGQVVAFDTRSRLQPQVFVRGMNHYLPEDIAVKAAYRVAPDFDPRRMALARRYRYTILNSAVPSPLLRRTTYRVAAPLEVGLMQAGAAVLVGTHDFGAFAAPPTDPEASTVRRVTDARVWRHGALVIFEVEGNAFLTHQVRRMAGALVDVGKGALSLDTLKDMVEGRTVEAVAHALPGKGLCLLAVRYRDFPPRNGEGYDDQEQAFLD